MSVETTLLVKDALRAGEDAVDVQHLQLAQKVGDFLCCSGSALAEAWCVAQHDACGWSFYLINRAG